MVLPDRIQSGPHELLQVLLQVYVTPDGHVHPRRRGTQGVRTGAPTQSILRCTSADGGSRPSWTPFPSQAAPTDRFDGDPGLVWGGQT